jgi:hypothetical protein
MEIRKMYRIFYGLGQRGVITREALYKKIYEKKAKREKRKKTWAQKAENHAS